MEEIRSLILRITERCNLHCAYCYAAGSCKTAADMTEEIALHAVSLCCPTGGSLNIQLTGGEPLLNLPVIEAVYAFGEKTGRKLRLSVQTNGTLLTPEICRRLAAMKCAVGVSLDGPREANALRIFPDGSSSFSAVTQGIRNLGCAGLRCNITTVITSQNVSSLGQIPDLALWLGNVRGVGLDLFRHLGRGAQQEFSPSTDSLTAGLQALIQRTHVINTAGVPFRLRELERLKKRAACSSCGNIYCYAQTDQSLCVDSCGNCWPCSSLVGETTMYLGNISNGLPQINRNTLSLDVPDPCNNCSSFSLCCGGCPAGRLHFDNTPAPLTCVMHRAFAAELEGGYLS